MVRLYLFAEGQTEQTFAHRVIKPHLAGLGVYLQHTVLIAHARKKGKVHRGGGRNHVAMKNDILRFLKQEKRGDAFFTTMIDLYALHADFPRRKEAENLRHVPQERVKFLEESFASDINDPRFIPYIQLHEFEAYLFSNPLRFEYFYDDHRKQIAALEALANSYATPELIDDGQHTAPSKRIIAQLPDYEGAKSVEGPQVAELIGLETIRNRCPHFDAWLSRLENLAVGCVEVQ